MMWHSRSQIRLAPWSFLTNHHHRCRRVSSHVVALPPVSHRANRCRIMSIGSNRWMGNSGNGGGNRSVGESQHRAPLRHFKAPLLTGIPLPTSISLRLPTKHLSPIINAHYARFLMYTDRPLTPKRVYEQFIHLFLFYFRRVYNIEQFVDLFLLLYIYIFHITVIFWHDTYI